jgi:Ulp1 family protease
MGVSERNTPTLRSVKHPDHVIATDWQVPLQTNFSDCGLYLVHYANRLLKEPETILKLVEVCALSLKDRC